VLGHLLDGQRQPEDARARPAVLGGDAQAQQPRVAEDLEEVLRVLAALVDLAGAGLDLVLRQAADGGLELGQLGRQLEVHRLTLPTR
jgi:hypothetical protein